MEQSRVVIIKIMEKRLSLPSTKVTKGRVEDG